MTKRVLFFIYFFIILLSVVLSEKTSFADVEKIQNSADSCITAKCHAAMGKDKFTHTPFKQKECTACHNPHGSSFKFNLLAKGTDLCFNCHD